MTLDRTTGEYTYVADTGATGTEDLSFTVRRRIPATPVLFQARMAVDTRDIDGSQYLYSLWQVLSVFLGDPPVDPVDVTDPPLIDAIVGVQASAQTPAELPKTGSDPEDLALAGLALLTVGAAITTASRRRMRALVG